MNDLQLPDEVRPLWIEGVFRSEFERDTLPLLFASERIYSEYYDALVHKNPHVSVALEQIRERNTQAREQRAAGLWQDCVESLIHCVHLRRCVFEETDYQFTAAQKHCVLALLNLATYFLQECSELGSRGGAKTDALLMRSFDLFKRAEEVVGDIKKRTDRLFLRAAVQNNFASYFVRRRKCKAAAQRLLLALRAWSSLNIRTFDLYFAVQKGGGELWSNRFSDSLKLLKEATAFAPPLEDSEGGAGQAPPPADADTDAPVRFGIGVLGCAVGIAEVANIALHYNIAVALVGLRRYRDAAPWCAKAMELAAVQQQFLTPQSPIVKTIHRAQSFCERMAVNTRFVDYRMKQSDFVAKGYGDMQNAVSKSEGAVAYEQRRRALLKAAQEQEEQRRKEEEEAGAAAAATDNDDDGTASKQHQQTDKSRTPRKPQQSQSQSRGRSRPASQPATAEALRTYMKGLSYRQLVEEFGFEGKRKRPVSKRRADRGAEEPKAEDDEPADDGDATTTQEEAQQPPPASEDGQPSDSKTDEPAPATDDAPSPAKPSEEANVLANSKGTAAAFVTVGGQHLVRDGETVSLDPGNVDFDVYVAHGDSGVTQLRAGSSSGPYIAVSQPDDGSDAHLVCTAAPPSASWIGFDVPQADGDNAVKAFGLFWANGDAGGFFVAAAENNLTLTAVQGEAVAFRSISAAVEQPAEQSDETKPTDGAEAAAPPEEASKPKERRVDIIVHSATGLPPDTDTFSGPDPFVVVRIGEKRFETAVAENKAQPVWDAEFSAVFTVDEATPEAAVVRLWEDDSVSDDKLGEATLSFAGAADGEWASHDLVVRAAKDDLPACIVAVKLRVQGLAEAAEPPKEAMPSESEDMAKPSEDTKADQPAASASAETKKDNKDDDFEDDSTVGSPATSPRDDAPQPAESQAATPAAEVATPSEQAPAETAPAKGESSTAANPDKFEDDSSVGSPATSPREEVPVATSDEQPQNANAETSQDEPAATSQKTEDFEKDSSVGSSATSPRNDAGESKAPRDPKPAEPSESEPAAAEASAAAEDAESKEDAPQPAAKTDDFEDDSSIGSPATSPRDVPPPATDPAPATTENEGPTASDAETPGASEAAPADAPAKEMPAAAEASSQPPATEEASPVESPATSARDEAPPVTADAAQPSGDKPTAKEDQSAAPTADAFENDSTAASSGEVAAQPQEAEPASAAPASNTEQEGPTESRAAAAAAEEPPSTAAMQPPTSEPSSSETDDTSTRHGTPTPPTSTTGSPTATSPAPDAPRESEPQPTPALNATATSAADTTGYDDDFEDASPAGSPQKDSSPTKNADTTYDDDFDDDDE